MMKRNLIMPLLISIVIALPSLSFAAEGRRDGNWWRQQDIYTRATYIVGFFDGMTLGRNISCWNFAKDKKIEDKDCLGKVLESYGIYFFKYFKNVTNTQIADGLDTFYADYRNRSIKVNNAVWVVVNGIAGTPQEELDKMIENFRRNVD